MTEMLINMTEWRHLSGMMELTEEKKPVNLNQHFTPEEKQKLKEVFVDNEAIQREYDQIEVPDLCHKLYANAKKICKMNANTSSRLSRAYTAWQKADAALTKATEDETYKVKPKKPPTPFQQKQAAQRLPRALQNAQERFANYMGVLFDAAWDEGFHPYWDEDDGPIVDFLKGALEFA